MGANDAAEIRYDTWNAGTRRPSNYHRAAEDLRRYAQNAETTEIEEQENE